MHIRTIDSRTPWWTSAVACLVASCGAEARTVLAWPALDEHELAFVVELKAGGGSATHGPFPADGPRTRLQLSDSERVYVLTVDTRPLPALHRRVDDQRLADLRIVERPQHCLQCTGVCRGESDDRLFHPLSGLGRAFGSDGTEFVELDTSPDPSWWLELPARWDCPQPVEGAAFEVLERWPRREVNRALHVVADEHVLALTEELRVIGARPGLSLVPPAGASFAAAVGLSSDRVYVSVDYWDGSEGAVLELGLGADHIEIKRETRFPFSVTGMYFDESGLVVAGKAGQIATSTDGVSFRSDVIPQSPGTATIARLGEPAAPFLLGSGAGGLFRGHPWLSLREWSYETLGLDVASTVGQFGRTQAAGESVLWARTFERGLFVQRPGGSWERPLVDLPGSLRSCRSQPDACGFSGLSQRVRPFAFSERTMFAASDGCPALLAMRIDLGCASAVSLVTEEGPVQTVSAVALLGDHVYVLLPEGVIRTRVSPFF